MGAISLLTLNVNGIRDPRKRKHIFHFCKLLEVDVVLLQETHISCWDDVHLWSFEWDGSLHASFGSEVSCGTVILLSPKLACHVGKVERDHEGRVICLHLLVGRIFLPSCQLLFLAGPSVSLEEISIAYHS